MAETGGAAWVGSVEGGAGGAGAETDAAERRASAAGDARGDQRGSLITTRRGAAVASEGAATSSGGGIATLATVAGLVAITLVAGVAAVAVTVAVIAVVAVGGAAAGAEARHRKRSTRGMPMPIPRQVARVRVGSDKRLGNARYTRGDELTTIEAVDGGGASSSSSAWLWGPPMRSRRNERADTGVAVERDDAKGRDAGMYPDTRAPSAEIRPRTTLCTRERSSPKRLVRNAPTSSRRMTSSLAFIHASSASFISSAVA